MSGGKPVLVSSMYRPRACREGVSDQRVLLGWREEASFSRGSLSTAHAGQLRMACSNVYGLSLQLGQESSGSSPNHDGWAAK